MGEKSDQIERHIQEQREELGENINELQDKVKGAFDWRVQFEHRPATMLGLAVGGGLLLSTLVGRSRGSRRSRRCGNGRTRPALDLDPIDDADDFDAGNTAYRRTSSPWKTLKSALAGVAATKLGLMANSFLPGLSEEYGKTRSANDSY